MGEIREFKRSERKPWTPYKPKKNWMHWDADALHFKRAWKTPVIAGAVALAALAGSHYYVYRSGYGTGREDKKKEVRQTLVDERSRYMRYLNDNPTEYEARKNREFITSIDNTTDILEYRRVLDKPAKLEIKNLDDAPPWYRALQDWALLLSQ